MADLLLNATTKHQIWLQRYASHLSNEFDPVLKDADVLIREVLTRVEKIETTKQFNSLAKDLNTGLSGIYGDWSNGLFNDIELLTQNEIEFTGKLLDKSTEGVEIALPILASVLGVMYAYPTQFNDKGEAGLLKPIIGNFSKSQTDKVIEAVRRGFKVGLTNDQILRKIRGTKANKFKDGILSTTKNSADIITRTSVNHVANQAKMETFWRNRDIVTGWVFIATLDVRTTQICRHNDQQEFKLRTGPVPPLHLRCRSTIGPLLKDKFSTLTKGASTTRASKGSSGGKQTQKSPYYQWLSVQSKEFQDDVLGKTKGQLFRDSGLSDEEFKRLVSNNLGQPLTLEQIKRKDPQAWENAGLDTD